MKIIIASPIDPPTIEKLHENHDVICPFGVTTDVLKRSISDRELLIFRSGVNITEELMESAPDMKLIIRGGSGIDNIDLEYVHRRRIEFVRVPGPGAQAVAEMSFALMLALSRNLLEADRSMRQGRWAKYEMAGHLLTGKTLGIVGLGNIGTRVGQVGVAWGMKVIGCVEHPSPSRSPIFREKSIRLMDFNEVISSADYVSLHVPLKDSTRNLINADVFSRMKIGSFLVNLARGGVLDEKALSKSLVEEDRLLGAALDVHLEEGEGKISPLAGLSNVILTPHIGAMAVDSQREIGHRIIEIVDSFGVYST